MTISKSSLPDEVFSRICALALEGRKPYGFRLQLDSELPDGGEIIRRIIALCTANGLSQDRTYDKTSYGYHVDRCYGECLLKSELLILARQVITRAGVRNGQAILGLDPAYRVASVLVFRSPIVVSEEVRHELQRHRLTGLRFGEIPEVPDPESQLGSVPGPFWELQSSILLPKMANTNQFVHPGPTGAEVFRGDYSKPILIADPPFTTGEVHYLASDLNSIARFDIGRTFEKYMERFQALVISPQFYRCCLETGIGLIAEPVRIDCDSNGSGDSEAH